LSYCCCAVTQSQAGERLLKSRNKHWTVAALITPRIQVCFRSSNHFSILRCLYFVLFPSIRYWFY
jgi:hypothetical protein